MFYFVELMRAKGALRIALILLGLLLIAAILLRFSVHPANISDWTGSVEHSPTAHVTTTQLPDGSTRTVVDDPVKQTHAVIVRRGSRIHMEIREPSTSGTEHETNDFGNVSIKENVRNGVSRVTVDSHGGVDYDPGLLFLGSMLMGLIVATLLAGPLAKENDGHLELAWTKPVSRETYAVAAFAVDICAIVGSQLMAIGVALAATLLFVVPNFSYGPHVGWNIFIGLLGPLGWYAFLTAASASLKRGPGLVIGLGWLFATLIPGLAGALTEPARFNTIARVFYTIFHTLSYLDPLTYMTFHNSESTIGTGFGLSIQTTALALLALSIGYFALSVLQWRRVEA